MNATQLESVITEALDATEEDIIIETFDSVGMLTRDRGLVLRFASGDEFQVHIVQSRYSKEERDRDDE